MNYYIPRRWGDLIGTVARILGPDGQIWLADVRLPQRQPVAVLFITAAPELAPAGAPLSRIDVRPDDLCLTAIPDHAEAVAMLLRGFPRAELLTWEIPE